MREHVGLGGVLLGERLDEKEAPGERRSHRWSCPQTSGAPRDSTSAASISRTRPRSPRRSVSSSMRSLVVSSRELQIHCARKRRACANRHAWRGVLRGRSLLCRPHSACQDEAEACRGAVGPCRLAWGRAWRRSRASRRRELRAFAALMKRDGRGAARGTGLHAGASPETGTLRAPARGLSSLLGRASNAERAGLRKLAADSLRSGLGPARRCLVFARAANGVARELAAWPWDEILARIVAA